ncbi:hypothetical protein K437DRAFT_274782 [Tilletiaria anomala UBC 951]|uniref:Uncharacterized protein n=1 Tax=Tilletiaria anomala (strain ATCC 24038 / CBS 436.72 / UBC 951) TaxID=1037660 RepID=A0A066VUI9_TILAU|nr:uncharacterized protein K437DRAFT_274782 [Tilletiaria anomala UBC 951]KDN43933.1 hypothetical protein K437DRAFT_274782 [Tilletiaria anomala UBC 951]
MTTLPHWHTPHKQGVLNGILWRRTLPPDKAAFCGTRGGVDAGHGRAVEGTVDRRACAGGESTAERADLARRQARSANLQRRFQWSATGEFANVVPQPALVWGAAGIIPNISTAASPVYLIRQANMVAQDACRMRAVAAADAAAGADYSVGYVRGGLICQPPRDPPRLGAGVVHLYRFWLTAFVGISIIATLAGTRYYDTDSSRTSQHGARWQLTRQVEADAKPKIRLQHRRVQGKKGGGYLEVGRINSDVESESLGDDGCSYVRVRSLKREEGR